MAFSFGMGLGLWAAELAEEKQKERKLRERQSACSLEPQWISFREGPPRVRFGNREAVNSHLRLFK